MDFQDISLIRGYHAHVYFDAETIEFAKTLCEEAGKLFSVKGGNRRFVQRSAACH